MTNEEKQEKELKDARRQRDREVMTECLEDANIVLGTKQWDSLRSHPEAVCLLTLAFFLGRISDYTDLDFKNKLGKLLNEVAESKGKKRR